MSAASGRCASLIVEGSRRVRLAHVRVALTAAVALLLLAPQLHHKLLHLRRAPVLPLARRRCRQPASSARRRLGRLGVQRLAVDGVRLKSCARGGARAAPLRCGDARAGGCGRPAAAGSPDVAALHAPAHKLLRRPLGPGLELLDEARVLCSQRCLLLSALGGELLLAPLKGCLLCATERKRRELVCRHRAHGARLDRVRVEVVRGHLPERRARAP
mmetsp:Transcript_5635/g.18150  ORF Transcript_5635/g.18150 Transcript_5635/m.18150 type:complete len:216 (-) Transcript_5635:69-716(-)